jgi:hypothetical protein
MGCGGPCVRGGEGFGCFLSLCEKTFLLITIRHGAIFPPVGRVFFMYVDVKMLFYYVLVYDANLKSFDGLAYKGMRLFFTGLFCLQFCIQIVNLFHVLACKCVVMESI